MQILKKWETFGLATILLCIIGGLYAVYGQNQPSIKVQSAIGENNQIAREFFELNPPDHTWGQFREVQSFTDQRPEIVQRNRTRPSEYRDANRTRNRGYGSARDTERAGGTLIARGAQQANRIPIAGSVISIVGGGWVYRKIEGIADGQRSVADRAYEAMTNNNYVVKEYNMKYSLFFTNLSKPVDVFVKYYVKVHKDRYNSNESRSVFDPETDQWVDMGIGWKDYLRRLSLNDALAPFKANANAQ